MVPFRMRILLSFLIVLIDMPPIHLKTTIDYFEEIQSIRQIH